MIQSFYDTGTEDIFNGRDTKAARGACPSMAWKVARRKLDQLNAASTLNDLRAPPKNQLEALKRDRKGQHAIRINAQYRVCFVWKNGEASRVEVTDYH
jgi:toxin HigB-1